MCCCVMDIAMTCPYYGECISGLQDFKELEMGVSLGILRDADIVGMTSTGFAIHYELMRQLRPRVLIVEEAAEMTEGQLLACLLPTLQHVLLFGDHKQLQPSVECYELQ